MEWHTQTAKGTTSTKGTQVEKEDGAEKGRRPSVVQGAPEEAKTPGVREMDAETRTTASVVLLHSSQTSTEGGRQQQDRKRCMVSRTRPKTEAPQENAQEDGPESSTSKNRCGGTGSVHGDTTTGDADGDSDNNEQRATNEHTTTHSEDDACRAATTSARAPTAAGTQRS